MTSLFSKGIATMSFSLLALCTASTIQAQEVANVNTVIKTEIPKTQLGKVYITSTSQHTIKGTVLDEENLPLPGVNVILKGTTEGTVTDLDGKFEFPTKLGTDDVLVFSYIGYETKEYLVKKSSSEIINITINFTNVDVELMGEIEIGGIYKTKQNIFQKFVGLFK